MRARWRRELDRQAQPESPPESKPAPSGPPPSDLPHVHYCKDVAESTICFKRGYCECKCGARSPLAASETSGWTDAT